MKQLIATTILFCSACYAFGQQAPANSNEKRVSLTETAVALDNSGASVLEANLNTTGVTGTPDAPVTNIRMTVRNSSTVAFAFVSGLVTFYDAGGVRCGEGIFKADSLAANESFETDAPGIRIRCAPTSWRLVATNLVPRVVPSTTVTPSLASARLIITVDGEQHPIQLGKPMTLNLSEKPHTIVVREGP